MYVKNIKIDGLLWTWNFRTKLKQTEVDCEVLKRCCENLTEENRRLQKEVQELRALKLSPQFYMQMTPPTTLTMCPSCERVAVPSDSAAARHHPVAQAHHRPVPIGPWASAAPIPHRPFVPSIIDRHVWINGVLVTCELLLWAFVSRGITQKKKRENTGETVAKRM